MVKKFICFIGPSGCGKGTQAELLIKYGFEVIVTSDILRQQIDMGDDVGLKIQETINQGRFVDDFDISVALNNFATDKIKSVINSNKIGVIFDGVPRTLNQYNVLNGFLDNLGASVTNVVIFKLPDESAKKRIANRLATSKQVRSDDIDPKVIKNRLESYRVNEKEIINNIPQGVEIIINAEPSIEEIHSEIVQKLGLNSVQL